MRKTASSIAWVGRTASMVFGLALTLALVLGLGTAALAAVPGDPFKLGRINSVGVITQLVGATNNAMLKIDNDSKGPNATALELEVDPKKPPMRINSFAKVEKLNADLLDGRESNQFVTITDKASDSDKIDGLDSTQIGINGYQRSGGESAFDSNPFKFANADCPPEKRIIGGGGYVIVSGSDPNGDIAPIALRRNGVDINGFNNYEVSAVEVAPYGFEWKVVARAICADVGNP